jgi:tRNA(Ile)-lysidine synthase
VAGHRLRHAFYARVRRQASAEVVATGHTANDLAETFLLRALRGAGLRGLAGIGPSRPGIVRPLLTVSRDDVLGYLAELGQSYREDATNLDTRVPRNRIRHELMPWLERHVTPRAVASLARTAALAAADEAFMRGAAAAAGAGLRLGSAPGKVGLDVVALRGLPVALQRRVVLAAIEDIAARPGTSAAVDRLLDLAASPGPGDGARFPGGRAQILEQRLWLTSEPGGRPPRSGRAATRRPVPAPGLLPIPGTVALPTGATVEASRVDRLPATAAPPGDGCRAYVDEARLREPLTVRFRRPGDRLRPLGMAGRKTLQDLFVDRKVPRTERDDVPLVVDADGRIIWVAGHAVANEVRVTSATTSVLLLHYRS